MPVRRSEISLFVTDLVRSAEFYSRALGFARVDGIAWESISVEKERPARG